MSCALIKLMTGFSTFIKPTQHDVFCTTVDRVEEIILNV